MRRALILSGRKQAAAPDRIDQNQCRHGTQRHNGQRHHLHRPKAHGGKGRKRLWRLQGRFATQVEREGLEDKAPRQCRDDGRQAQIADGSEVEGSGERPHRQRRSQPQHDHAAGPVQHGHRDIGGQGQNRGNRQVKVACTRGDDEHLPGSHQHGQCAKGQGHRQRRPDTARARLHPDGDQHQGGGNKAIGPGRKVLSDHARLRFWPGHPPERAPPAPGTGSPPAPRSARWTAH